MQRSKSIIASKINMKKPRLSESFICSSDDSMKSISDCATMVSEVSLMEDNYHYEAYESMGNSFITQTPDSYIHSNPNAKKNKILFVESRLIETKDISQSDEVKNEMNALLQIQRKTERLVQKQRQQRKQLSKLKKLYIKKEEELGKYQERLVIETNCLRKQIEQVKNDRLKILEQKQCIENLMHDLQLQRKQTYIQMNKYKAQREELMNQIELYEINFWNTPITTVQEKSIKDIDRQINIISSLIKKNKAQKVNHQQLEDLLEIKIKYLEKRQNLKVNAQRQKHESIIKLLNQSVSRRNCLIKSKNITIQKLLESDQFIQQKGKEGFWETSDTFLLPKQQQQESLLNNQNLGNEIIDVIQSHCIAGYQQTFEAIQTILIGINNLQQSRSTPHQDLINLVDITLQNFTSKLVCKAKQKLNKIQGICDDKINLNK